MKSAELYELLRDLRAGASRGPADVGIYDPDADPVEVFRANLAHGSGDVWTVWLPEHPATVLGAKGRDQPEHAVTAWVTGNGPQSEANARFIAAVFHYQREILDLVDAGVRAEGAASEVEQRLLTERNEAQARLATLERFVREVVARNTPIVELGQQLLGTP